MDYYVSTPTPDGTPVSEIKGYGLSKRPIKEEFPLEEQSQSEVTAMDQLIDQAKALIDTAKTFITKPVNRKHGCKGSPTSSVNQNQRLKHWRLCKSKLYGTYPNYMWELMAQ